MLQLTWLGKDHEVVNSIGKISFNGIDIMKGFQIFGVLIFFSSRKFSLWHQTIPVTQFG